MAGNEQLGFAKIKGHRFWPAVITGQTGGRMLVSFLGSDQCGYISSKKLTKEWAVLSQISLAKFATVKNFKAQGYKKGVLDLIDGTEFCLLESQNSSLVSNLPPSPAPSEVENDSGELQKAKIPAEENKLAVRQCHDASIALSPCSTSSQTSPAPCCTSSESEEIKLEIKVELSSIESCADVIDNDISGTQMLILDHQNEQHKPDNTTNATLDDENEFDFDFNNLGNNSIHQMIVEETDTETSSDNESVSHQPKTFSCNSCGDSFHTLIELSKHTIKHVKIVIPRVKLPSIELSSNKTDHPPVAHNSSHNSTKKITERRANPSNNKAGKKQSKLVKTLRENEEMVLKKFAEKIYQKDDVYHCNVCDLFVTRCQLIAKNHAFHCGDLVQKNSRKSVSIKCNHCEEKFGSKKDLNEHFKLHHQQVHYSCSICSKKFKYRENYAKHLAVHRSKEKTKHEFCPHCGKSFHFKCYMKRHLKTHMETLLRNRKQLKLCEEFTDLALEVNQEEVRKYRGSFGQLSVACAEPVLDQTEFFSTLGFYRKEDFEIWYDISKKWELPVSADGSRDTLELAYGVNEQGFSETATVIWSDTSSLDVAMDILNTVLNDVILEDELRKCSNEDLKQQVDDLIQSCEAASDQLSIQKAFDNLELSEEVNDGPITDLIVDAVMSAEGTENIQNKGLSCPKCDLSGLRDKENLRQHIKSMHENPQKCTRCKVTFVDMQSFRKHVSDCFYWCPRPGCDYHDKRENRMEAHSRRHKKEDGIEI